jgi:uncharacterized membrane protein YhhN
MNKCLSGYSFRYMIPHDSASSFLIAAAAACVLHLRAAYRGPAWRVYLYKPLTTLLLLGMAALMPAAHGSTYRTAILAGLVFSLLGDVFLMLPRDRFIAGLASFLAAHVAYIVAFSMDGSIPTDPQLLWPLGVVALTLLGVLWPGLGRLRVPVVLYALTIVAMVWRAWARSRATPTPGTALAAVGAALFLVSDSLLAFDRFRHRFPGARAAVQISYVAAQALIAMSTGVA